MKRCFMCKNSKPLSDFHKSNRRFDDHEYRCKECVKAYTASRKEIKRLQDAEYRKENRERIALVKALAAKEYNQRPETKQRAIANQARRRAIKLDIPNTMPDNWWNTLIEFYGPACMNPDCPYDQIPGNPLTHDHVVPLTTDGSSHSLENSQILCKRCNSAKNNRLIDYRNGRVCSQSLTSSILTG